MREIEIYTDGACSGNPGPGGYGAILDYKGKKKEISAGFKLTTNNRMEILAAIAALECLKEPCKVTLYSDSRYLVDAVEKNWVKRWRDNGWKRNKADKALNVDLWERLLKMLDMHEVSFKWVKGHASNPQNNRCDELARGAAQNNAGFLEDTGYK